MKPMIEVKKLSKKYRIRHEEKYFALRDEIVDFFKIFFKKRGLSRRSSEDFWALSDISFNVEKGEVIGIIGRNGAGKTTLLKVISRITHPTQGEVRLRGRVASLLEVGTGFHPELTGRENIYFNGSILGMKKREIDRKFEEIISFAEVEKFLDTPIKRYSSGMRLRLAFAIAAHLEPEILLIDEVLAVGDTAFQKKCLGRMEDVAREGRTVLFVSHNMSTILNLCPKTYLLDKGRILMSGKSEDVVAKYLEQMQSLTNFSLSDRVDRKGDGRLRFIYANIKNKDGAAVDLIRSGQDVIFSLGYETSGDKPLKNVYADIAFYNSMGQFLFLCINEMVEGVFKELPSKGEMVCRIPRFPLAPGHYYFNVYCKVNDILADWVVHAGRFNICEGDFFGTGKLPPSSHGGFLIPHSWDFKNG